VNREEYFPYGETSFGSFAGKRYRFTGNERDEHDAPYYHRSRYYAPWLARWTSPDPEGVLDGINLYQYARTNPLRYVDPGGTQSEPSTPADDDGGGYGLGTLLSVLLPARTEPLKKSRDIDLEGLSPATKKYLKMAQVTDESRPLLQIHGAPVEMYHAFFPSKRHIRHASIEELRDIIERDEWAITVLKPIKYAGDVAQLYLTVQSAGTSAVAMSGVKSASTASKLKLVYHAKKLQAAAVWTGFEAMQLTRNTVGLLRGKRVTHEYGEMVAGKEGKMVQLSRESFLALSDLYRGNKAEKTLGALQLLTNFVEARDLSRGRRKLVKENLTETEFEQLKRLRKDNIQTKQTK
jgi:RHS repeat-associated protein